MPEVLELKPIKDKNLKLVMLESEFPIDWFFNKQKSEDSLLLNLHFVSKKYLHIIEGLIDKYNPKFVLEEKGNRDGAFTEDDPLRSLFREKGIPYEMVDISEEAEDYLRASLEDHEMLIKQLGSKIDQMIKANHGVPPINNETFSQLIIWRNYLQDEYNEKENEVRYKVREAWMMMKVLKKAKTFTEKKLTGLLICDERHFEGLDNLAKDLNVLTEQIKLQKTVKIEQPMLLTTDGKTAPAPINSNSSMWDLAAIKVKKADTSDKICYFFDTDDFASPFDINMAYDAGFDVVVPIPNMKAEKVPKLVQDAIFSRKPNSPTTFFIGGSDVNEGEKIAKKVLKSLVPPFECPVIIDPRGSHTTASAVVAMTINIAKNEHKIESLKGKKIVIFGAGPVGRIAAILGSKIGAEVFLVETWEKGSKAAIEKLAEELTKKAGEGARKITGVFAPKIDERIEIAKDATIIWSLAAAGVEILPMDAMKKIPGKKIVVDINLVPPYGIEGIKPKYKNEEIYPGIFGIGALALGRLKSEIESSILKEAAKTKGKKIFDFNYAFEVAMELLNK
ncbi:MAG: methylene-tetrahydromethanopterin dehydrogenase N-terminal domain-containing protein [Promethearchaeota archaeon]